MNLREALGRAGIYPVINPGEIWKAKDSSINLIGALTRHFHEERYCLILSNQLMCADPDWPLVLIAPLSHLLYPKARPDLLVDSTYSNGLEVESRVILSQIQPLRKIDLQERCGEISRAKWEQIIKHVFWHIDRR